MYLTYKLIPDLVFKLNFSRFVIVFAGVDLNFTYFVGFTFIFTGLIGYRMTILYTVLTIALVL